MDRSAKGHGSHERVRPRRDAHARREQRARAAARTVGRVIEASVLLATHRGCSAGAHLAELAALLREPCSRPGGLQPARSSRRPADEGSTEMAAAGQVVEQLRAEVQRLEEAEAALEAELEKVQPLLARLRSAEPKATLAECWGALQASDGLLHPARRSLRAAARRAEETSGDAKAKEKANENANEEEVVDESGDNAAADGAQERDLQSVLRGLQHNGRW